MWGLETLIDLKHCDQKIIRSKGRITKYATDLVNLIGMKAFGMPQVVEFGSCKEVKGFTLIQLIETSLISAHFVNYSSSAFINIFSCKDYDSQAAIDFSVDFFGAQVEDFAVINRGSFIK